MKKGIWIIIVIAIIVIGIICGVNLNKTRQVNSQNVQENEENKNQELNEEISNIINEIDDTELNTVEENVVENTTTETFEETPKTEEEKAISIVKKDYGTSENIKISVEGMDENGRHIVVVRNSETTQALAFYFVNVSNSTFTKKEMN